MPTKHADDGGDGGELEGGREDADDVLDHRARGQHALAEVALQHMLDVDQELLPQRQVETEGDARLLVDHVRGAVADDGEHRIDRHHAADQEGDQEEAQEGDRERERQAGGGAEELQHGCRGGCMVRAGSAGRGAASSAGWWSRR